MYPVILALHNLNRWVVLIAGLLTLVGVVLWARREEPPTWLRSNALAWLVGFDFQFLLGLILVFISPVVQPGWSAPFEHEGFRYFVMEHGVPMVFALALVHWGYRNFKRQLAGEEDFCWCRVWQWFIAWLIILAVTPWDRPLFPAL